MIVSALLYIAYLALSVSCQSARRRIRAITRSPFDKASYTFLALRNGLEVLVISDPSIDKVFLMI